MEKKNTEDSDTLERKMRRWKMALIVQGILAIVIVGILVLRAKRIWTYGITTPTGSASVDTTENTYDPTKTQESSLKPSQTSQTQTDYTVGSDNDDTMAGNISEMVFLSLLQGSFVCDDKKYEFGVKDNSFNGYLNQKNKNVKGTYSYYPGSEAWYVVIEAKGKRVEYKFSLSSDNPEGIVLTNVSTEESFYLVYSY